MEVDNVYKVVKIDSNDDVELGNAYYYAKNQYNRLGIGDKLTYKQMIKSYNRIVGNSAENISKILLTKYRLFDISVSWYI